MATATAAAPASASRAGEGGADGAHASSVGRFDGAAAPSSRVAATSGSVAGLVQQEDGPPASAEPPPQRLGGAAARKILPTTTKAWPQRRAPNKIPREASASEPRSPTYADVLASQPLTPTSVVSSDSEAWGAWTSRGMTGGSPDAGADVATSGDIARGSADGLDHGARGSADGSARGTQPLAAESVAAEAAPGVKRARGTKHRGGLKEQ